MKVKPVSCPYLTDFLSFPKFNGYHNLKDRPYIPPLIHCYQKLTLMRKMKKDA